jgi:hypothetical protein
MTPIAPHHWLPALGSHSCSIVLPEWILARTKLLWRFPLPLTRSRCGSLGR